jgi:hypothetical protein
MLVDGGIIDSIDAIGDQPAGAAPNETSNIRRR